MTTQQEAIKLAHDHMRLYLPHYTKGHNVFDAMVAALDYVTTTNAQTVCQQPVVAMQQGGSITGGSMFAVKEPEPVKPYAYIRCPVDWAGFPKLVICSKDHPEAVPVYLAPQMGVK